MVFGPFLSLLCGFLCLVFWTCAVGLHCGSILWPCFMVLFYRLTLWAFFTVLFDSFCTRIETVSMWCMVEIKMRWFLSAISSRKLIALNKHSLWGCFHLVLTSQLSRLKQCGLSVLLKDTNIQVQPGFEPSIALSRNRHLTHMTNMPLDSQVSNLTHMTNMPLDSQVSNLTHMTNMPLDSQVSNLTHMTNMPLDS